MSAVAVGVVLFAAPAMAGGPPHARQMSVAASMLEKPALAILRQHRRIGPVPGPCLVYTWRASLTVSRSGAGQDATGRERIASVPSPEATPAQSADVVRLYLFRHPELRDKAASWLALKALVAAFPCATPPGP